MFNSVVDAINNFIQIVYNQEKIIVVVVWEIIIIINKNEFFINLINIVKDIFKYININI